MGKQRLEVQDIVDDLSGNRENMPPETPQVANRRQPRTTLSFICYEESEENLRVPRAQGAVKPRPDACDQIAQLAGHPSDESTNIKRSIYSMHDDIVLLQ